MKAKWSEEGILAASLRQGPVKKYPSIKGQQMPNERISGFFLDFVCLQHILWPWFFGTAGFKIQIKNYPLHEIKEIDIEHNTQR